MKLGVSYNLFDGEELLEKSILSIRSLVDHVNVVYQKKSNRDNNSSDNLEDLLNELKSNEMIDSMIEFFPDFNKSSHQNEITKRNIGLEFSRKFQCTHHMSMDTDEFYKHDELLRVKNFLKNNIEYDSSACQMQTYYKAPSYCIDPPEDYYVSLIYKIKDSNFSFVDFPVLVDPTRRIQTENCAIFGRDVIEMHHMSYIRNDIRKKLENSSAYINFSDSIDHIVEHFNNWSFGTPALFAGLPNIYRGVKQVENIFNI
jgi:hypothetical protein